LYAAIALSYSFLLRYAAAICRFDDAERRRLGHDLAIAAIASSYFWLL